MPASTSLVEVEKDGVILRVHPTNVAAHVALGWVVVDKPTPDPKPAVVPVPAPAPKPFVPTPVPTPKKP